MFYLSAKNLVWKFSHLLYNALRKNWKRIGNTSPIIMIINSNIVNLLHPNIYHTQRFLLFKYSMET